MSLPSSSSPSNSSTSSLEELDEQRFEESRASISDHLADLAQCVKMVFIAVIPLFIFFLIFREQVYYTLTDPLYQSLERLDLPQVIKYRTVQGAVIFHLKTAALMAIIFSIPVVFWQGWRFIAPGLTTQEQRLMIPFIAATSLCFIGGVLFCYYLVIPFAFDFFLSYSVQEGDYQLQADITLEDYLSTFTKLIFAFGFIFETPIFLSFLSWFQIITHRTLIRYWRGAVVGSFIVAAMLTPPDYITQTLLALPLISFYGLSMISTYYITKYQERKLQAYL